MERKRRVKNLIIMAILFIAMPVFAAENPKIEVTPGAYDFGRLTELKVQTHTFRLKNIGKGELIISRVSTSCGCTAAVVSKNKLKPGESTELKVTFDPNLTHSRGRIKRDIYIESNDPDNPTKVIPVTLNLDVDIRPKTQVQTKAKEPVALTEVIQPPKISSKELYSRLQKEEKIVVLDVREENEYIGKHIPDAIWFPKSKFDKEAPEVLKKLEGIDKKTPIVTYCGAGHRSSYVARKLRERGYNAYNLDGISFWEKEGLPLIRGPKLPSSQEPSIIHLEEAYENYYLLFKDVVWVDVRDSQDYKRGHIKGALSIPLSEIKERLNELPKDREIVLYCEGTSEGGSCEASRSAGRILITKGYSQEKIKVFEDGYGAWENAGYPVEKISNNKIEAVEIYRQFTCACCGHTVDKCRCPMGKEIRTYLDGLIEAGLSEEQILIKGAKKLGLESLNNLEKQNLVRAELLKGLAAEHPELVIEQQQITLKSVSLKRGKIKKSLKVKNIGNKELVIKDIKTSCGCTVVALITKDGKRSPDFAMEGKGNKRWQAVLLAGDEADLEINFDPNFHPPKKVPEYVTRIVTISSNDPLYPDKMVRLNIELVE